MRYLWVTILILSLVMLAQATPELQHPRKQTKEPPLASADWSGIYHIQGEEGSEHYYGAATITPIANGVYQVITVVDKFHAQGVAQEAGGMLCIGWTQKYKDRDVCGCTVLQKKPSGVVVYWVLRDSGEGRHREDWTWLRKLKD